MKYIYNETNSIQCKLTILKSIFSDAFAGSRGAISAFLSGERGKNSNYMIQHEYRFLPHENKLSE